METNKAGNIFRGIGATTECYIQVRDMFKKSSLWSSPHKYLSQHTCEEILDTSGQIYEAHNDYCEFGAGRKLFKMIKTLQVYDMTII